MCLVFFLPGTLPPADLEPEEAFQASVSGRCRDLNTVGFVKMGHGHKYCRTVQGLSLVWGQWGAPLGLCPVEWSSSSGYDSGTWLLPNTSPTPALRPRP